MQPQESAERLRLDTNHNTYGGFIDLAAQPWAIHFPVM
jgi:hypothetical protein